MWFFSDLSTRILFLKQNFMCLIYACWNVMEQVKLTEMVAELLVWSNCAASCSVMIIK